MRGRFQLIGSMVSIGLLVVSGCGGSSTPKTATGATSEATTSATTMPPQDVTADKAAALSAALKLSDLPTGWTGVPHTNSPSSPSVDTALAACLGVPVERLNKNGPADVDSPDFSDANNNSISNSLGYTPSAAAAQSELATFQDPKVPGCLATALTAYVKDQAAHPANPSDTLPPGVSFGAATVAQESFPTIGDQSIAYRVTVPVSAQGQSITVYVDLVVAIKGRAGVEMDFTSLSTPFPSDQEASLITLVVGRLSNT
jgi:hypothetical protein